MNLMFFAWKFSQFTVGRKRNAISNSNCVHFVHRSSDRIYIVYQKVLRYLYTLQSINNWAHNPIKTFAMVFNLPFIFNKFHRKTKEFCRSVNFLSIAKSKRFFNETKHQSENGKWKREPGQYYQNSIIIHFNAGSCEKARRHCLLTVQSKMMMILSRDYHQSENVPKFVKFTTNSWNSQ